MLVEAPKSYQRPFQIPDRERIPTPSEQLHDYLSNLKQKVDKGFDQETQTVIKTADGRELFIAVLDPQKVFAQQRAMVVEAHPDDAILAGGAANMSADLEVGVSYVTLTDGSARELEGFADGQQLAMQRRQESVDSARVAGGAIVINLGYPDADLSTHKKAAAKEVRTIIKALSPDYYITTNKGDGHDDHSSGSKVARLASRFIRMGKYEEDTQTGLDSRDRPTRLNRFVTVPSSAKAVQLNAFKAHTSQHIGSVPQEDEKHVHEVEHMTQRHGQIVNREHATGLNKLPFSRDKMTQIFRSNGVEVQTRTTPRVLYERAKEFARR